MKVYLYDKEYARMEGCHPFYITLYSVVWVLSIIVLSLLFTGSVIFLENRVTDVFILIFSISYMFLLFLLIIVGAYFSPIYYLAKATAYVCDEYGVLWQVQFYQKNSLKRIIVNEETVKDYFFRYLHGESFWNIWWGGKCKITRLDELTCIKVKKRYDVCCYMNERNHRRRIRIAHVYPDLRRCYHADYDILF